MNTASNTALEALPHWDLSNVYSGLEEADFVKAMEDFRAGLDQLDDLLARRDIARGGAVPAGAISPIAPLDAPTGVPSANAPSNGSSPAPK